MKFVVCRFSILAPASLPAADRLTSAADNLAGKCIVAVLALTLYCGWVSFHFAPALVFA